MSAGKKLYAHRSESCKLPVVEFFISPLLQTISSKNRAFVSTDI